MDFFLILSATIIFITSLFGVILASLFRPSTYLIYAQTFACGSFLSVSLLHFLPRAAHCFSQTSPWSQNDFPISCVIAVLVFLFFLLAELFTIPRSQFSDLSDEDTQNFTPLLMHYTATLPSRALEHLTFVFLFAHAAIIGFALYFQHKEHPAVAISLLVNTAVEKFVESFAVALLLKKGSIKPVVFWVVILIWAAGTPITIGVLGATNLKEDVLLDGVFLSVSAGVFLFIAVVLWRKTFLTPFEWRKKEIGILAGTFVVSLVVQALTCISVHV